MEKARREQILAKLKEFPNAVVNTTDWPAAYPGSRKTKAIVLGCDPTAFDRNGKPLRFEFVFGIGGKDIRYFMDIEKNLHCIGLHIDDVYVQNFCQNYFTEQSTQNKAWREAAQLWIPILKRELQLEGIPDSVPVLLTSELLYKALLNDAIKAKRAGYLYSHLDEIPIRPSLNRLERPLIPLYRHPKYRLFFKDGTPKHSAYRKKLASLFS